MDKLSAVIQYVDTESLYDIIRLSEAIDEFEYIAGTHDFEEIGQKLIEEECEIIKPV